MEASLEEVMEMTSVTSLKLYAVRPFDLSDYPDLPIRLRGALGRALYQDKDSRPVNRRILPRPSAYDCLFGKHGDYVPGFPIPAPFGISCETNGNLLNVNIHLLGLAEFYAEQILTTMAETMTRGISLAADQPKRVSVPLVDMGLRKHFPFAEKAKGDSVVLKFSTPLQLRSNNHQTLAVEALMHSGVIRLSSLSRWSGFETGNLWQDLKAISGNVEVQTADMVPVKWTRHSIRQKGIAIPMSGFVGPYRIIKGAAPFLNYLRFGELFGIGSKANLGMGSYKMAIYPY